MNRRGLIKIFRTFRSTNSFEPAMSADQEEKSMSITINQEQQLFVIPAAGGYSCLGFDVVFKRLKQIVAYLGLSFPVNESDKGSLGQYELYQKAVSEAGRANIRETWFDLDTPPEVRRILEQYRKSGEQLRLFYGDRKTGRDWMEENEVMGEIGRSVGIFKVPLLIEKSGYGGPAILDACILRLMDVKTGKELYRDQKYRPPELEIRSTEGLLAHWHQKKPPKLLTEMGYTHGVWAKNDKGEFENQANFKSYGKACQYVAFMTGDSMCKPS